MKICYIDESGCTGILPNANSDIQPVLVVLGLFFDYAKLHEATEKLLDLKQRFYPSRMEPYTYLGRILDEVKGIELRKNACADGRKVRRHSFGYLDGILSICQEIDARLVGRVWIKGIGQPFDGQAVYSFSIQSIYAGFHDYLARQNDLGIVIADSRVKGLNTPVAHSIFTQKFKGTGDAFDRILELPAFAHSDNHAGLQLADVLCSGIVCPTAIHSYCVGHVTNVHIRPRYAVLKDRYRVAIRGMQHRYQEANERWRGGLVVSDALAGRPGSLLFSA